MTDNWPDFNDEWDYGDPAGTEAKFRARLPEAEKDAGSGYHLQLLTQIARAQGLQKKFDEAHALLDEVQSRMEGGDVVEVRCLLERGRAFNSAKEREKAVPLFSQAATIANQIEVDFYAVDALHMLGIAAPPEKQLAWNQKAITYAENSKDERARGWLGSLYNNTGWTLFDQTKYDEALDIFKRALEFREQQGNPETIHIARWCIARTLRALDRIEEALAILHDLEETGKSDGFVDEEIAECLHAQGKTDEARPYFMLAYEKLSAIDWVAEDTERITRLKELSQAG